MSERKVSTDALETLGMIHPQQQFRDAIHLAVEPVIAGERLSPGEHIFLRDGKAYGNTGATNNPPLLGIVDPFLEDKVKPGQQFWLVIYPRKITSLRHVWSHPGLPDEAEPPAQTKADRSASEVWMRKWAMEHVSEDYYGDGGSVGEDAAYAFAIEAGHEHRIGCYEDARDHIDSEWWGHWEAITGCKGDREAYFSCAC
jgi:hypothetical protein